MLGSVLFVLFAAVAIYCGEGDRSSLLLNKANAAVSKDLNERLDSAHMIAVDPEALGVVLDLKYATQDNLSGKQIYKTSACFLHVEALDALKKALAMALDMGYSFKLFDCFRPIEGQEILFSAVNDTRYVSDPSNGPRNHCRGMAVDIGLIDAATGKDLDFGTSFDSIVPLSHTNVTKELSPEQLKNRLTLAGIMSSAGFIVHKNEWWHFDLARPAVNNATYNAQYPVLRDEKLRTGLCVGQGD